MKPPNLKPSRIVAEREDYYDRDPKSGERVLAGWDWADIAYCDRHGTSGDWWYHSDTSGFCNGCRRELVEWRRATQVENPGAEWSRFDEASHRVERANEDYLERLEG